MSITNIINVWSKNTDLLLDISNLYLTEWPKILTTKLTNKIKHLICSGNLFSQIPKLPLCQYLTSINGKLTKINTIKSILEIDVRNNELISIPGLIKCIKAQISNNNLKTLPKTLTKMKILDISNNPITNFSSRVTNLEILLCSECKFKTLPQMKKLKAIRYFGTEITPPKGVRILTKNEGIDYKDVVEEVVEDLTDGIVEDLTDGIVEEDLVKEDVVKKDVVEEEDTEEKLTTLDIIEVDEEEYTDIIYPTTKTKTISSKKFINFKKTDKYNKKEIEKEIWSVIPNTFGPIQSISLDNIETIRGIKLVPKLREKIIIEDLGELEISEGTIIDFDDREMDKDIMNLNEFINIFDLKRIPSSGVKVPNYKGPDIQLLAVKAGIPYVDYSNTIKRLIYVYIHQTNLLFAGIDFEKIEMIAKILGRHIKRKKTESDIELVRRWYDRFNLNFQK